MATTQFQQRIFALSETAVVDEVAVLLWCFWQCWLPEYLGLDTLFARVADPTECKVAWMGCSWQQDVRGELILFRRLEAFTTLHCIPLLALRWWRHPGLGRSGPELEGSFPGRYRKILAVLKHIESEACRGSALSFLAAAERFAMQSEGAWLKVAGGQKGDVLEHHLHQSFHYIGQASLSCGSVHLAGRVAVECGAFIGYTASRLASKLQSTPSDSGHVAPFVSIEGDPVHTLVARHFVDFVQLAQVAEVRPGMVRDVIPSLIELFGSSAIAFMFMDQKGTTFHVDLALCDRIHSWARGATVVADNVLRPGAPVYVWVVAFINCGLEPGFWSLPEFLEEAQGVEDWMAIAHVGWL